MASVFMALFVQNNAQAGCLYGLIWGHTDTRCFQSNAPLLNMLRMKVASIFLALYVQDTAHTVCLYRLICGFTDTRCFQCISPLLNRLHIKVASDYPAFYVQNTALPIQDICKDLIRAIQTKGVLKVMHPH